MCISKRTQQNQFSQSILQTFGILVTSQRGLRKDNIINSGQIDKERNEKGQKILDLRVYNLKIHPHMGFNMFPRIVPGAHC